MMPVLINNRQNKKAALPPETEKAAQAILNALDCPDAELSILLVDDPRIADLNKTYLNRSGPTNVMLVTLLIPVSGISLGVLVLGETLLARHITGALVIGAGLLVIDGRVLGWLRRRP